MITQNIYYDILLICGVIIISYLFSWISRRTRIPSVLLLVLLGIGGQFMMEKFAVHLGPSAFNLLQMLGIVGLIMIVLEAALDLTLSREKSGLILRAFIVALLALGISSVALAYLIRYFLDFEFYVALLYAIPLSVMSSAIIIPSVAQLAESKKEFLIYESTFSDILGIMFFYFAIGTSRDASSQIIVRDVGLNVLITIGLSVLLSYLLVLIFQKIEESARLFLLIAVLIALYATGKIFHLSSLIVILVFGLTLSNYKVFFPGKLRKLIDNKVLIKINHEFHLVTLESAFVVRTFFFVVFGLTLDLPSLLDLQTAVISAYLVAALFLIRFVCLRLFTREVLPALFIAPRGLITILLFFGIPAEFLQPGFSSGILLYTILATAVVMMIGMIFHENEADDVEELHLDNLEELDKELVKRNNTG